MFIQYDSTMTPDLDDAYVIHSTNSIFPNDHTNSWHDISIQKVCNINNENCDNTDVFWRYIWNSWFHNALCNQWFSTDSSYNGDYAYCHNGVGSWASVYEANSLFWTRSSYNEIKLWKHEWSSKNFAERVYIRSSLPLYDADFFITTWKTDNPGTSNNTSITIPTYGVGYNYDVDWTCDGVFDDLAVKGSITHNYSTSGTYNVCIRGKFPQIYFNNSGDKLKIIDIKQWWSLKWRTMLKSFYWAWNLDVTANDAPDLSQVTDLSFMFRGAKSLVGNYAFNNWNVSNVTNISSMFRWATNFNQPLNNWDTSNMTNMSELFYLATNFNQPLSNWNTSNVKDMAHMFNNASSFNQPLNNWNTSNVTNMTYMFNNAVNFNQPISNWNTSNVTNMSLFMFNAKKFNQSINTNIVNTWTVNQYIAWNVWNVKNFSQAFSFMSEFNQDLDKWDITWVSDAGWLSSMFSNSKKFNWNISTWDTSKIRWFNNTLSSCYSFNQDISKWDFSSATRVDGMLMVAENFSDYNYDALLRSWHKNYLNTPPSNWWRSNNYISVYYCEAWAERQALIDAGWKISDSWKRCSKTYAPLSKPNLDKLSDTWKTNTDKITNNTSPSFTWTCLSWSEVKIYLGSWWVVWKNETSLATTTCSAEWIFSTNLATSLTWGLYQISYTQKTLNPSGWRPESEKSPWLNIIIDDNKPHSIDIEIDTLTNNSIHFPILKFKAQDSETWIWKYELEIDDDWNITTHTWAWVITYSPLWMDQNKNSHKVKIKAYDIAWNSIERIVEYPPIVNIQTWSTLSNSPITISAHIYWPNIITNVTATGSDENNNPIWDSIVCTPDLSTNTKDTTCTINIKWTWYLKIFANDSIGAEWYAWQTYIIDTSWPTITIVDDIDLIPTKSESVKISVSDNLVSWWSFTWANLLPSSYKYILITWSSLCDATSDFSNATSFSSDQVYNFSDESFNWKYICTKAEDKVGNTSYKKSTNPFNIDLTPPNIDFWTNNKNINKNNSNQDYTLMWVCSYLDNPIKIEIVWTDPLISQTWSCKSDNTFNMIFSWSIIQNLPDWDIFFKLSQGDQAENISTKFLSIIKDTVLPSWTINYSTNTWTNSWLTLNLIWSENIETPDWWDFLSPKNFSKIFTQNWSWTIIIIDNTWNTWSVDYNISNIDNISPNCWDWELNPKLPTWSNTSILAKLNNSTDLESWINIWTWSCSIDTKWWNCSLIISDNAWNTKNCTSPNIDNLDLNKPNISISQSQNLFSWSVKIDFSWNDSDSWINKVFCKISPIDDIFNNCTNYWTWKNIVWYYSWSLDNWNYSLEIFAIDNANNTWSIVKYNFTVNKETSNTPTNSWYLNAWPWPVIKPNTNNNTNSNSTNNTNNNPPKNETTNETTEENTKTSSNQDEKETVNNDTINDVIYIENKKWIFEYQTKNYESCNIIKQINENNNKETKYEDVSNSPYLNAIKKLENTDIIDWIKVWDKINFEPKRNISRAEFLKIILKVHCYEYKNISINEINTWFKDIDSNKNSWQAKVIEKAKRLWLVNWYNDWNFRADREISKIEAMKIMLRIALLKVSDWYETNYTDINEKWQKKYAYQLEQIWLMNPKDSNYLFNPDLWVSREFMVKLITDLVSLYK